jgi:hypothetical protein
MKTGKLYAQIKMQRRKGHWWRVVISLPLLFVCLLLRVVRITAHAIERAANEGFLSMNYKWWVNEITERKQTE